MERTSGTQRLCGRRKCKNQFRALRARFLLGRYHPTGACQADARNPITTGFLKPPKSDRPSWRQVAGPPVDVHLATIGGDDAVRQNDRNRRRSNAALTQRHRVATDTLETTE